MKLKVIFDNYLYRKDLVTGWGFSTLVERNGTQILFDTGSKADILLDNARKMGLNLSAVKHIFISHWHWDHTGGLWELMKDTEAACIYGPSPAPPMIDRRIEMYGGEFIGIGASPTEILDGYVSTGSMDAGSSLKEHSLIVDGKVLVVGCSHPGIVKIVERFIEIIGRPPQFVVGGFHLGGFSPSNVSVIADALFDLGVGQVAPCHCTGARAREIIRRRFGNRFVDVGVGFELEI